MHEMSNAHADFADQVHVYISDYIRFADTKAAFIFGAGSAILAFLYNSRDGYEWLAASILGDAPGMFGLAAMLFTSAAIALAITTVFPRRKGSRRGFIFWEAIAEYGDTSEYAAAVAGLDPTELTRVKLHHCYELALVCRRKYRTLDRAMRSGAVGVGLGILYLFLI